MRAIFQKKSKKRPKKKLKKGKKRRNITKFGQKLFACNKLLEKVLVSDLNISHGKMSDFVSFSLFRFTLFRKLSEKFRF